MGLKGNFRKVSCQRLGGKMWSFELSNTNWILKSTYNIAIYDANRQQPWFWRGQVLDAGKTVAFNYDTVDWLFCQGDTVVLLDDNNRVIDQWTLQLREYGPGECPECHGSHKCRRCNGNGYVWPRGRMEEYTKCPDCDGTGICQTCYVPRRTPRYGGAPTGLIPM